MSEAHGGRQIPADVANIADYAEHARQRLTPEAWAYFSGGAGDELTLAANRRAWDEHWLAPRVLKPLGGGHTRVDLLGRTWPHPLLLAPVAFLRMAHPDGELGVAMAAAAQGAGLVLSTQASTPLEPVAQAVLSEPGRGPLWFQLYWQHDLGFMQGLLDRVVAAGYEALVLTVDAPTSGVRDRERRAGFKLPPHISAVNLAGLPPAPTAQGPGQSPLFDGLLHTAPTWREVAWLCEHSPLPVLLKGVLHADDARQARQVGAAGVVVSNHGGRTLDTAPATAWALPAIADAVGGEMAVLVDGGIRRGTDVLKAIALGAQAVLVGRPYVHALATAGALGVAHVVRLLRDEFEAAMALTGCATVADIGPSALYRRP